LVGCHLFVLVLVQKPAARRVHIKEKLGPPCAEYTFLRYTRVNVVCVLQRCLSNPKPLYLLTGLLLGFSVFIWIRYILSLLNHHLSLEIRQEVLFASFLLLPFPFDLHQLVHLSIFIAMESNGISEQKIITGDSGYILQDVPHLTDYIPDLPVCFFFFHQLID